ncbi:MAG: YceD family protein [Actinomycetota bacterium]
MQPIDVRELLAHPGSSQQVHVTEPVPGLATELVRVPEGAPVDVDVLLENVVEGILVSGPLAGTFALRCARCLTGFVQEFRIEVHELYAPGATDQDDQYPLSEGSIDLDPMVRDNVMLSMPFSPLCRPDCRGLCERCGGDRNLGECSCGPDTDPRWSALDRLSLDE